MGEALLHLLAGLGLSVVYVALWAFVRDRILEARDYRRYYRAFEQWPKEEEGHRGD